MERLGRYVLLEKIAEGGMAEVFRGAAIGSAGFAVTLAIKRILPHHAQNPSFIKMFVDEAKMVSSLQHPNIVHVMDLGQVPAGGTERKSGEMTPGRASNFFLVMEFVAGRSLAHVIRAALRRGQRLPLEFVLHVASQALSGLAFAHGKRDPQGKPMNIIHRDISPQNILVSFEGTVKLADFGIAKANARSSDTLTGSIKGKPGYMAPEQVVGQTSDQRLDLYAMGVVIHEMVAMRRMRTGDTDVKLLMQVAEGRFPRFSELGIAVPEGVANVIYKALEPDPNNRWSSAEEFLAAVLKETLQHQWHWSASHTRQLMADLCAEEVAAEDRAIKDYAPLVDELAKANSDAELDILLRQFGGERPPDNVAVESPTTPMSSSLSGARHTMVAQNKGLGWVVAAGLTAGLALAGMGTWVILSNRSDVSMVVESTPDGAEVVLDGKLMGTTPRAVKGLHAGLVEVELSKPGFLKSRQVVMLEAGPPKHVTVQLQAALKPLRLESKPFGAQVTVDGKAVGTTPLELNLPLGATTQLVLALEGYEPMKRALNVDEAISPLVVELQRGKAPPPPRLPGGSNAGQADPGVKKGGNGTLTVTSKPWAKVTIDGKDTGKFTPLADVSLPVGSHTVVLTTEDGVSATLPVTIQRDQETRLFRVLR